MAALRDGLPALADAAYAAEQERVAPGSGRDHRRALAAGPRDRARSSGPPSRETSSSRRCGPGASAWPARRRARCACSRCPACDAASRDDPERSWQLLRRMARGRARLDQRRRARRGLRPRHPRGAVPLGGAGAAGLLRRAHGATARRLHARPTSPTRCPAARRGRAGRPGARWRSSASSWAMPTTRSRRRSPGRSGVEPRRCAGGRPAS